MSNWRVLEPAPRSAVLAVSPPLAHLRKQVLFQAGAFHSAALFLGAQPMAVATMRERSCQRLEFALCIDRAAARHMRAVLRVAHLTLAHLSQTHVVYARIRTDNRAGQRMARLSGFQPSKAGPEIWIWRQNG